MHSWTLFTLGALPAMVAAMGLSVQPADASCAPSAAERNAPAQAANRLPDSQVVAGSRDIAWVWLSSPTHRYPHGALGSAVHAGSVQVLSRSSSGAQTLLSLSLPVHRVFEDRVPRLVDLDGDGRDEIVLVEADALRGAALVVLGLAQRDGKPTIVERARGPHAGSTFRWLNPVGFADFDGDGQLDVASVTTPHIGGVLTLHHLRPPELVPFARALDVSNHRMGALEQQLAVIVQRPGLRPTIIVPDMTRQALHALRWDAPGQWHELADLKPLPGTVERLAPGPGGACAWLADGRVLQITLLP
ncbi:FG-GAP repeat domain-containing protein [Hydrogenophaga sp.]|uniref:FG-GAP repeat domain-containing protein n=1 Tax=Hydrogenophaga sp. TaxID=1904254 RepID=UPI002FC8F7F9